MILPTWSVRRFCNKCSCSCDFNARRWKHGSLVRSALGLPWDSRVMRSKKLKERKWMFTVLKSINTEQISVLLTIYNQILQTKKNNNYFIVPFQLKNSVLHASNCWCWVHKEAYSALICCENFSLKCKSLPYQRKPFCSLLLSSFFILL